MMMNSETKPSIFVITGMHRSGTSLTASLLQSAGVDIGKKLMGPAHGNVKGYFENIDFVKFHKEVLYSQGISKAGWTLVPQVQVQEQYIDKAKLLIENNSSRQFWGWKDPRTTLFLNFWANLLPEAKFLLIYRAPWEVVDSLYRRGNVGDEIFNFNPEFALKIWMNYNQTLLNFNNEFSDRCLLLSICSITNNPIFLVKAIEEKFGIVIDVPASDIYDKSLFHTQVSSSHRPALIKHYFPEAFKLYYELNTRAFQLKGFSELLDCEALQLLPHEAWVFQDWLDVRKLERQESKLQLQLQQTQAELEQSQSQLQQTQAELEQSLRQATLMQFQLQQTQIQLEQIQLQWQQTKAQLEKLQLQLQQTQADSEHSRSQLQQTQAELEHSRSRLQQTQAELEQSQTTVAAMKTSKFWQLRTAWFWVKRTVRLPSEPKPVVPIQVETPIENVQLAEAKLNYAPSVVEAIPGIPHSEDINYQKWLNKNYPRQADLHQMAETAKILSYKPVISVIMPVFNPPERFLREAIESVLNQIYPYWELCIADDASSQAYIKPLLQEYAAKDARVKVVFRSENGHISHASNSALEIATGEFVALLDHDDVLNPHALYEVAFLLNKHPEADIIYSDEDKIDDDNQVSNPYFKPDWCPDSFLSRMYTCHLGTYRRSLLTEIEGFRVGYEGSQDYDLVLRLTEKTNKIFHIPKILYSWRIHPQSASSGAEAKPYAYVAAEKALTDALTRRGEKGFVSGFPGVLGVYGVRYQIEDYKLVSIIIPTKDLGETLDKCLKSIFNKSTYPNYEVIVIDNGSTEEYTEQVINYWQTKESNRFRCYKFDIPFNYSKINNYGVSQAKGDYLLFLNNDTEVISPEWIDAMVEQAQRPSIGAVGALLLYPDESIQHAGVVLGIGGIANHSHKKFPFMSPGYFCQAITINNYSAVTGACLMCKRKVYESVGGFEEKLAVAFNDVDFCLKVISKGYRNIYLPHVVLYHYESKSRGVEDTLEKQSRFTKEIEYMQAKWQQIIDNDPCYSPHLTRKAEDYSINI